MQQCHRVSQSVTLSQCSVLGSACLAQSERESLPSVQPTLAAASFLGSSVFVIGAVCLLGAKKSTDQKTREKAIRPSSFDLIGAEYCRVSIAWSAYEREA